MKRILVPTDFSGNAHNAFRFALHIAEKYNASITTLHVVDSVKPFEDYSPQTFLQKMENELGKEFEKYQKEAALLRESAEQEMLTKVQVNHILKEGDKFITEILDVLTDESYDLIVMGTKGATNISKIFLGSNTSRVMENAPCPVLVVPTKADYADFTKIAYAMEVDLEEDPAIDASLKWAKYFNGDLTCFTVEKNNTKKWDLVEAKMNDYKYEFRKDTNLNFELFDDRDIYFGIHNFIKFRKINLLVMVYRKLGIVEKFFLDRKVRDITLGIDIPFLILKD